MKVSFLDFWEYPKAFNPNNNFLTHLIKLTFDDVKIVDPIDADVIIYTCFGNEHKKYNQCKKIFYTGECLRPDYNQSDYSITFDFDSYDNRNIRIPLWYFYIDWFSIKTYNNPEYLIPVDYLTGENEFTKKEKSKFCSAVFSKNNDIRFQETGYIDDNTWNDFVKQARSKSGALWGTGAVLSTAAKLLQERYGFEFAVKNLENPGTKLKIRG